MYDDGDVVSSRLEVLILIERSITRPNTICQRNV
jgi:hypothetical protein